MILLSLIISLTKFNTMTSKLAPWRLRSPASWLFIQSFIQAQIRENIKALRHWPLCGEFTGDRWITRIVELLAQMDSNAETVFYLITSSSFGSSSCYSIADNLIKFTSANNNDIQLRNILFWYERSKNSNDCYGYNNRYYCFPHHL